MSSYRYLLLVVSALFVYASEGRPSSDSTQQSISSFHSLFSHRAFTTHQQHSHTSANNANSCSVQKFDAELQPLDDEYRICEVKFNHVSCDGDPISPSLLPNKMPCNIPKDAGSIRFKCHNESSNHLPLFAINATMHFHHDGTCDFDLKSRTFCDGECLAANSLHGRSNCLAPNYADLTIAAERCE